MNEATMKTATLMPQCERDVSEFESAIEANRSELSQLEDAVGHLLERLTPVLKNQPPCDPCDKVASSFDTAVAAEISSSSARIRDIKLRVGDAIDRLGI